MKATRLLRSKILFENGAIQEMVIWQLPEKTSDRPHGLKYRLHYGLTDGTCLIRYDNETGKGDHRHVREREEPYVFTTVRKLVEDFLSDVAKIKAGEL
jgi:hypothetical protein